jgi:hypothetical protein
MPKLLLHSSLFGAAILMAAVLPAEAFNKRDIGTRTKEYMKNFCTGSDRKYVKGQGQYGCISNCGDPKNTSDACGINCSEKDNKCYGWTPAMQTSNEPKDIIRPKQTGSSSPSKSNSSSPSSKTPSRPSPASRPPPP